MEKNICPKTALRCDSFDACKRGNCRFGAGPLVTEASLSKEQKYQLMLDEQRKQKKASAI